MQNYKLFIRSMRVMGKKRFCLPGIHLRYECDLCPVRDHELLLMKCVVDIAQTGEYERLGYSIVAIVVVGVISTDLPCGNDPLQCGGQASLRVICRRGCWMQK